MKPKSSHFSGNHLKTRYNVCMHDNGRTNEISPIDFSAIPLSRLSPSPLQQQLISKVSHLEHQLNPLVSFATPLLLLAFELQTETIAPDLKKLHEVLNHEVKVMELRALQHGYRSQMILAARYLICAFVDETILATHWGKNCEWHRQTLLSTFQREASSGEHFFLILDRSAEEPAAFIDVLELGYICLKLGFQGKYRKNVQSLELENFTDNLYHLIKQVRNTEKKELCIANTDEKARHAKNSIRFPRVGTIVGITLLALCAIFYPYYHRLETLTAPFVQAIENLGKTIQQSDMDAHVSK
jgi:type VI secretion system protein ImpK